MDGSANSSVQRGWSLRRMP